MPEPPAYQQDIQEELRTNFHAILEGRDSPMHPNHCPGIYLGLAYLNLPAVPDRRVRALRYLIAVDRLWYAYPEAAALVRTLPAFEKQALLELSKQFARPPTLWTWETLLPQIAQDQVIFRKINALGPTEAGVAPTSDPNIAPKRYGMSKSGAKRIYDEYHRQASILLGRGMLPPKAWAAAMEDKGLLNAHGRIHALPFGFSAAPSPFLSAAWNIDMPWLPHWEAVYHWFAHALRNLCRYQNGHPPVPWPDNHTSCHLRCERELQKLLAHCDPPSSR
jgi:hypothetical protein